MLQQIQGFAARRSAQILRCVIPRQLVEVGIARVWSGHHYGTEATVDWVARVKWQTTVVLGWHVRTGMNVRVLGGWWWWWTLRLHRRLDPLLLALGLVTLAEILGLLLFRLVLGTRRRGFGLRCLHHLVLSPLLTGVQVVPSVVLNWRRCLTLILGVIHVVRTHLTLHLYTLLQDLMVLVLFVLHAGELLGLLLDLGFLIVYILIVLGRGLRRLGHGLWLIRIARWYVATVATVVVRLLLGWIENFFFVLLGILQARH